MLTNTFTDALTFAAQLHATQERKGNGVPYISHLLGVASLVLEYGGDEDQAIAALLHDAIEDQAVSYAGGAEALRQTITERFGSRVLEIVEGCTDAETIPKPPWQARKEAYITHLYTANADILLVSCADKLHNARAILRDYRQIGDALWERFTAGKAGVLWYYRSLADAFLALPAAQPDLAAELDRTVTAIETLSRS